jgi:hypothetical protein
VVIIPQFESEEILLDRTFNNTLWGTILNYKGKKQDYFIVSIFIFYKSSLWRLYMGGQIITTE